MQRATSLPSIESLIQGLSDPDAGAPIASSAALAGAMAASLVVSVCGAALQGCRSEKAESELEHMRKTAISLRRDLLALVSHAEQAAGAVAAVGGAPAQAAGALADPRRLRALLFASEVPLRTAESCHALLNLCLRALGRAGIRSIAEVGAATALAFAGVVGGIVTSRTHLAGIPAGTGIGAAAARKRAERILRDAEALRTQIIDRVRQHLP